MTTDMFNRKHWLDLIIKGYEEILVDMNMNDFPEFLQKYKKYRAERASLSHQIAFYYTINYQAIVNNEIDQSKHFMYKELMFYHRQITKIEAKIVDTIEQALLM